MNRRLDHLKSGDEVTVWWFDGGPFTLEMDDGSAHTVAPDQIGIQHPLAIFVVPREDSHYWLGRPFDPGEEIRRAAPTISNPRVLCAKTNL